MDLVLTVVATLSLVEVVEWVEVEVLELISAVVLAPVAVLEGVVGFKLQVSALMVGQANMALLVVLVVVILH
jgi:hypothetical protein